MNRKYLLIIVMMLLCSIAGAQNTVRQNTIAQGAAAHGTAAQGAAAQGTAAQGAAGKAAQNKNAQTTALQNKAAQTTALQNKAAQTTALQGKAAQTTALQGNDPVADTVIVQRNPAVDSTLVGVSVFDLIGNGHANGEVEVNQSASVDYAFKKYVEQNAQKKLNGFRIRIFFDNKQSARVQSEEVEKTFIETFPQYPVYRTYTNPYFKVAVGDFRTKSDAVKVLQVIQKDFPKAFIIKDIINYPL